MPSYSPALCPKGGRNTPPSDMGAAEPGDSTQETSKHPGSRSGLVYSTGRALTSVAFTRERTSCALLDLEAISVMPLGALRWATAMNKGQRIWLVARRKQEEAVIIRRGGDTPLCSRIFHCAICAFRSLSINVRRSEKTKGPQRSKGREDMWAGRSMTMNNDDDQKPFTCTAARQAGTLTRRTSPDARRCKSRVLFLKSAVVELLGRCL